MFDLQHAAGFLRAGRTGGDKREQRQARDREALSEWLHKPPPFRGAEPLKLSSAAQVRGGTYHPFRASWTTLWGRVTRALSAKSVLL